MLARYEAPNGILEALLVWLSQFMGFCFGKLNALRKLVLVPINHKRQHP